MHHHYHDITSRKMPDDFQACARELLAQKWAA
jgi:hypothetical protein